MDEAQAEGKAQSGGLHRGFKASEVMSCEAVRYILVWGMSFLGRW